MVPRFTWFTSCDRFMISLSFPVIVVLVGRLFHSSVPLVCVVVVVVAVGVVVVVVAAAALLGF